MATKPPTSDGFFLPLGNPGNPNDGQCNSIHPSRSGFRGAMLVESVPREELRVGTVSSKNPNIVRLEDPQVTSSIIIRKPYFP